MMAILTVSKVQAAVSHKQAGNPKTFKRWWKIKYVPREHFLMDIAMKKKNRNAGTRADVDYLDLSRTSIGILLSRERFIDAEIIRLAQNRKLSLVGLCRERIFG